MKVDAALHALGVVRRGHGELETTPIQAGINRAEQAVVEVDEAYADGLDGLAGFDYAWLITWLHRHPPAAGLPPMRQGAFPLRRQQPSKGMVASRGPRRINPLGLSLVRIIEVSGATVAFAGVDVVDGTPVIDIKPYVTRFDRPAGDPKCGWFDHVSIDEAATPAQLAAPPDPPPAS